MSNVTVGAVVAIVLVIATVLAFSGACRSAAGTS